MDDGVDINVAAHNLINDEEPINFRRTKPAVLVFPADDVKTLRIAKDRLFRRLNFLDKI